MAGELDLLGRQLLDLVDLIPLSLPCLAQMIAQIADRLQVLFGNGPKRLMNIHALHLGPVLGLPILLRGRQLLVLALGLRLVGFVGHVGGCSSSSIRTIESLERPFCSSVVARPAL